MSSTLRIKKTLSLLNSKVSTKTKMRKMGLEGLAISESIEKRRVSAHRFACNPVCNPDSKMGTRKGNGNLKIPIFSLILLRVRAFGQMGLREGNSIPRVSCAVALGRYAVLFSTASRPFRLSAIQNACVCPCMGAFY